MLITELVNNMNISKLIRNSLLATLAATSFSALLPQTASAQIETKLPFDFRQNRSRLVVLLHGVTPNPEQDLEARITSSAHARYYWGFNFIKGLQGYSHEDQMRVITPRADGTMRFETYSSKQWDPNQGLQSPADLAPICFPVRWWTNLDTGPNFDSTFMRQYIRLMTKDQGAEATMVMVNTRDGSKHLNVQLGQAIDEIYESYAMAFGKMRPGEQPQIYLVGHSFGGVVARGIIAASSGADLFGNVLTERQLERAKFLRDRTVLVKTIATPHHGTPMPDLVQDLADDVRASFPSAFRRIYDAFPDTTDTEDMTEEEPQRRAEQDTQKVLNLVSGDRDCFADLMRMEEYNNGILRPTANRRSDNTKVPMYVAGGRNPGGQYYDVDRQIWPITGLAQFQPVNALDLLLGTRPTSESSALKLIAGLLHSEGYGREGKRPWGTATHPAGDKIGSPWAGYGPDQERAVEAPFDFSGERIFNVIEKFFDGEPYKIFQPDGEWDNDGFLGWDSANAMSLTGDHIYRLFDETKYSKYLPWDVDNHGSLMFNTGNGQWIHNELLRSAGPIVAPSARLSTWRSLPPAATPSSNVMVYVDNLREANDDCDPIGQADFDLEIVVGGQKAMWHCDDDTASVNDAGRQGVGNYPSTVIPITIKVTDRDNGIDDVCVASPRPGSTTLHMYYDTRTNLITGDVKAEGGTQFTVTPNKYTWRDTMGFEPKNAVSMKIRVVKF